MSLCRYTTYAPTVGRIRRWGWVSEGRVFPLVERDVAECFAAPSDAGLGALAAIASGDEEPIGYDELDVAPGKYGSPCLEAPLTTGQEVWAAGVTYESSKLARIAESAEGGDFYARVYGAERPELFFKGTPGRTVGPNGEVRVRADSKWNVPEPELAVVCAANGQILGYTIGNDMSSRDIEGENPLYLPQAKVYRASCALGPVIVPAGDIDPQNVRIGLTIMRGESAAYLGETSTARMRRSVGELVGWLFRENDFPHGVVLLTGTGLIPADDFSLQSGDEVRIEIEGIGLLRNIVA